jgi:hypothetical protein
MFGLGSKIESPESTKTPPRVPLTKDQWATELARHFKPEFQLRLAIWRLLFEKLVERNVFEDDESGRGIYNLVGKLDARDLEKARGSEGIVGCKAFCGVGGNDKIARQTMIISLLSSRTTSVAANT